MKNLIMYLNRQKIKFGRKQIFLFNNMNLKFIQFKIKIKLTIIQFGEHVKYI